MQDEQIQKVLDEGAETLGRVQKRLDRLAAEVGEIADHYCTEGLHESSADMRDVEAAIVKARAEIINAIACGRRVGGPFTSRSGGK